MIVGRSIPNFGRSLLNLNPNDYAHQLILPSPGKLNEKGKFHQVEILPLYFNIIECVKARNDDWAKAVLTRLGTSNDLVAEETVYHNSCMAAFNLNKVGRNVRGRPEDPIMTDVFQHICDWLGNTAESEVYSVRELYDKMMKDNNGVAYCLKTFPSKLKARYKNHDTLFKVPAVRVFVLKIWRTMF